MVKKIFAFFLVSVILILCLPLSGWAAMIATETALYEKYSRMLLSESRIEGEIAVSFEQEKHEDEMYSVLFDVCSNVYDTNDKSFIDSVMDFNPKYSVQKITVPEEKIVEVLVRLTKNPIVSVVEPNYRAYLDNVEEMDLTNLQDFPAEYDPGVSDVGIYGQWHLDRIGVQDSWDAQFGGLDTTIVAVLDSGYTPHTELSDSVDLSLAYNTVDENTNVYDSHGHGTAVAGVIGSAVDGIGTNGICANVKIVPIKVAAPPNYYADAVNIAQGLEISSDIGATVANISLHLQDGYETIRNAVNNFGHLVVFSAGNTSYELFSETGEVKANDEPLWIVVGASTYDEIKCEFSCYSARYVDLFAPGQDIVSLEANNTNSPYKQWHGTSFAAPMVTSAVAILSSHATHLSPLQIKERLLSTVDLFDAYSGKCVSGGRLNIYNAVRSIYNEERGAYSRGDVSGDGRIKTEDYLLIKRISLNTYLPTDLQFEAGDIDDNGVIDSTDYELVQKYLLGRRYFAP